MPPDTYEKTTPSTSTLDYNALLSVSFQSVVKLVSYCILPYAVPEYIRWRKFLSLPYYFIPSYPYPPLVSFRIYPRTAPQIQLPISFALRIRGWIIWIYFPGMKKFFSCPSFVTIQLSLSNTVDISMLNPADLIETSSHSTPASKMLKLHLTQFTTNDIILQ